MKVNLDKRGSVHIPQEYRQKLGMEPGAPVELRVERGGLRICATEREPDEGVRAEFGYDHAGKSLSEAVILERRERAAKHQSMDAWRNGDVSAALLLEYYEKLARHMAECARHGVLLSEETLQKRREMEAFLSERIHDG